MRNTVPIFLRKMKVIFVLFTLAQLLAKTHYCICFKLRVPIVTRITTQEDYPLSSCRNTTHSESSPITQIRSFGNYDCVNLYKGKGCQGWFVRWKPSNLYKSIEGAAAYAYVWNKDHDMVTSSLIVGSVGPCLDACDSRNWDNLNLTETVSVTVYENYDFKGYSETILVNTSTCAKIRRRVQSVQITGDESSCLEFHVTEDCSSDHYTISRPGYPMLNYMTGYGTKEILPLHFNAKAVRLCGKSCPTGNKTGVQYPISTVPTIITTIEPKPEEPIAITEAATTCDIPTEDVENLRETKDSVENPAWFYCLGVILLLIYTALIATLGALISSKYQAYSLKEDSKKFAVLFKQKALDGIDVNL